MNTVNLAMKVPDYGKISPAAPEGSSKTPLKVAYPSMTVSGNTALAKSLRAGQEFTATVKFRVSEIAIRDRDTGDDEDDGEDQPTDLYGGTRVELEAQSMTMQGVTLKEDSGEADGASAIASYFKKKGKNSEEE